MGIDEPYSIEAGISLSKNGLYTQDGSVMVLCHASESWHPSQKIRTGYQLSLV
jgi:hypothetical protein